MLGWTLRCHAKCHLTTSPPSWRMPCPPGRLVELFEEVGLHGRHSDVHLVLVEGTRTHPLGIQVFAFPGMPDGRRYAALARLLAAQLHCDAVCDGTPYAPPGDSGHPYWSLLWRPNEAWLADDAYTDPYDGEGGPVRPMLRLDRPLPALKSDGSLEER